MNAAFSECDRLTHAVGGSGRAAYHCWLHAGKGVHLLLLLDKLVVGARGTAIPQWDNPSPYCIHQRLVELRDGLRALQCQSSSGLQLHQLLCSQQPPQQPPLVFPQLVSSTGTSFQGSIAGFPLACLAACWWGTCWAVQCLLGRAQPNKV